MIKIAIVEDDPAIVQQLQGYLRQMETETADIAFDINTFGDGLAFLDGYKGQYDLVLMDIEMPLIDGMSTAQKLRERDGRVIIVFITYMTQYAVKGYSVNARDFIEKPVSYFLFSKKIGRICQEIHLRQDDAVLVKSPDGYQRLAATRIEYLEITGHNMVIHTLDGRIQVRCTLTEMEKKLARFHFLRCNNAYLVNPRFIRKVADNGVLVGETVLPISRPKKKEFLEGLAEYFDALSVGGGAS